MATQTRYVLDTQFYIDLLRGRAAGAVALEFLASHVTAVDFHALVGAELLVGAAGAAEATAIRRRLVDRFKPERLVVPDAADLLAAGDAIRLLRAQGGDHPEHARRNFWNDVVIAASCRRHGRVLISRDQDHGRISRVVKHRVLTALPAKPGSRRYEPSAPPVRAAARTVVRARPLGSRAFARPSSHQTVADGYRNERSRDRVKRVVRRVLVHGRLTAQ